MLDALAELFAALGMTAKTYSSAVAFLAESPRLDNGCILTDVEMPGMSGLELVQRLAVDGATTPVIVMTARPTPALEADCKRLGATAFLRKPLNEVALLASIEAAYAPAR